jgi:hypothetical protein
MSKALFIGLFFDTSMKRSRSSSSVTNLIGRDDDEVCGTVGMLAPPSAFLLVLIVAGDEEVVSFDVVVVVCSAGFAPQAGIEVVAKEEVFVLAEEDLPAFGASAGSVGLLFPQEAAVAVVLFPKGLASVAEVVAAGSLVDVVDVDETPNGTAAGGVAPKGSFTREELLLVVFPQAEPEVEPNGLASEEVEAAAVFPKGLASKEVDTAAKGLIFQALPVFDGAGAALFGWLLRVLLLLPQAETVGVATLETTLIWVASKIDSMFRFMFLYVST